MKISVFVPFGSHSQESGLMYLLANYLKVTYPEVVQLRCNGMFSVCDRDVDESWSRGIRSCFACIADQRALSDWSSLPVQDFSAFLMPDDVRSTKSWIDTVAAENLMQAEYRGLPLFSLCKDSFANRFGAAPFEARNKSHEQFARKMLLSAARTCHAAEQFQNRFAPDLTIVSSGRDFISQSFVTVSRALKRDVSVFRWDVGSRSIHISHPRIDKHIACELVPEGILGMRSDYKTWPAEVLSIVQGILGFLEVGQGQLKLPIGK